MVNCFGDPSVLHHQRRNQKIIREKLNKKASTIWLRLFYYSYPRDLWDLNIGTDSIFEKIHDAKDTNHDKHSYEPPQQMLFSIV